MTMSNKTLSRKRYLSPRFLAGKVRGKGVIWCLKACVSKVDWRLHGFACFLRRQGRDIREGGLSVLLRKLRRFLVMILAAPVVLVVRALRPVVVIRFGSLISGRIGHFALNTELYLCERDAGMHMRRTFDIFYNNSPVCNQQLKRMWDRTLHVSQFAMVVDRLNKFLPGGANHVAPMPSIPDFRGLLIQGLLERTRVHLSFTHEEERLGREALRELGIQDSTPFVCFHARDSAYLDAVYPNVNSRGHDYRDSTIHNYVPAAEELVRRGFFAIRGGAIVKDALTTTNPMIIDYATKSRTDFLDIFLSAKCRFFLGQLTGITAVPMIFRRPVAAVNLIRFEEALVLGSKDLFIPKKLWLREEHRFLTFREILDSGAARFLSSEQYEQLGVEVVENTPDEILALAVEMDERLKGTWQMTEEDEELQRHFWALFEPSELHGATLSRIGAEFLCQNRELLD